MSDLVIKFAGGETEVVMKCSLCGAAIGYVFVIAHEGTGDVVCLDCVDKRDKSKDHSYRLAEMIRLHDAWMCLEFLLQSGSCTLDGSRMLVDDGKERAFMHGIKLTLQPSGHVFCVTSRSSARALLEAALEATIELEEPDREIAESGQSE